MRTSLLSLLTVLLAVGLAGAQEGVDQNRLVVTGSVEMRVPADHASFTFTAVGVGASLNQAFARARKQVDLIAATLYDIGLPKDNLRLSYFYSGENYDNRAFFSSKQDYRANITAAVEIDSLELLEPALVAVSAQQPEYLSGINFTLRNYEQYKLDVLAQAATKAREKAEVLAGALNVPLGKVLSIEEVSSPRRSYYSPNPFNASVSPTIQSENAGGGVTLFPQDISLSASVKITVEIEEE